MCKYGHCNNLCHSWKSDSPPHRSVSDIHGIFCNFGTHLAYVLGKLGPQFARAQFYGAQSATEIFSRAKFAGTQFDAFYVIIPSHAHSWQVLFSKAITSRRRFLTKGVLK